MTIGLLTTSFPRFAGDYAGSFVGDRVQRLLDDGHEVEVIAAAAGDAPPTVREGRLTVTRIPAPGLFYVDGEGAPEVLERAGARAWWTAARFATDLAACVRARAARWRAIEAHWLVPCALAAAAAAPALPCRAYAHSGDVALLERLPLGDAVARALIRAGRPEQPGQPGLDLCFVTEDLRSRFAARAGAAAAVGRVTPLSAPVALFPRRTGPDRALRHSLGLVRPTILAVGRLVPIKGHERLVRACALARGGAPEIDPAIDLVVDLVILGDGPERARLTALADELGVGLRLPGFVPRAEVARWLRAADLYAQPSIRLEGGRTEGAPVATLEAAATGIPMVTECVPAALARAIRSHLCRGASAAAA